MSIVTPSESAADTTMGDIYRAILPFILCELIAMGVIISFPQIALSLPSFMAY